jgi:hypothetical protein
MALSGKTNDIKETSNMQEGGKKLRTARLLFIPLHRSSGC